MLLNNLEHFKIVDYLLKESNDIVADECLYNVNLTENSLQYKN